MKFIKAEMDKNELAFVLTYSRANSNEWLT
jgi:hypothetical protein